MFYIFLHTVLLTCVGIALAVPAGPDRSMEHKYKRASEVAAGPMFCFLKSLLLLLQQSRFPPLSLLVLSSKM